MKKTEMMNLIRKAKDRDPDAFTTLMQQYTKDMYRVAIVMTSEKSVRISLRWRNMSHRRRRILTTWN